MENILLWQQDISRLWKISCCGNRIFCILRKNLVVTTRYCPWLSTHQQLNHISSMITYLHQISYKRLRLFWIRKKNSDWTALLLFTTSYAVTIIQICGTESPRNTPLRFLILLHIIAWYAYKISLLTSSEVVVLGMLTTDVSRTSSFWNIARTHEQLIN